MANNVIFRSELDVTRTFPSPPEPIDLVINVKNTLSSNQSAVYFIWDKNKLIAYIGQTKRLKNRINEHTKIIDGDYLSWISCEESLLLSTEEYYINLLNPPRNGHNPLFLSKKPYQKIISGNGKRGALSTEEMLYIENNDIEISEISLKLGKSIEAISKYAIKYYSKICDMNMSETLNKLKSYSPREIENYTPKLLFNKVSSGKHENKLKLSSSNNIILSNKKIKRIVIEYYDE